MSPLRRPLLALAAVLSTLLLGVGPATAAGFSQSDPSGDVHWIYSGGIAAATAQERARIDLTWGAVWMDSNKVYARFHVRNWANGCTTGVPCSGAVMSYRLTAFRADGKGSVDLFYQQGNAVGVQGGYVNWSTTTGSGVVCKTGQVSRTVNTTNDYVTIAAPRWCFNKGWRLTKVQWQDSYQYQPSSTKSRYGVDETAYKWIDLTPKA